ncbi:hypothetical protein O3P69_012311 [Scylla paramamosain]|uniref:ERAP1-like C-terminal domain-containing protein n=1 Tax=Scylla paramamosain TaxID=85552 RepID=A0AAW0TE10_SCYPA
MQTPGVEVWEAMLHRYVTETNAQEKTKMAVGLASTTEDWVAQRLLGLATNESVVRSQDYFSMLNNLAKSPWNTYLVWDYVRSHWEEMVDRFTLNNRYLGRMVKYVITRLSSPTHLNDVKEFFEQYPEAGSGARSRKQALEELEGNIKWSLSIPPCTATSPPRLHVGNSVRRKTRQEPQSQLRDREEE